MVPVLKSSSSSERKDAQGAEGVERKGARGFDSGAIPEGGIPVHWVKSMELFPLGRQKLRTLYSFLEVFTNGIKPKKAI